MTQYEEMKATQLHAMLAERGLLETGMKTKKQYLQRLLEDDQRLLEREVPKTPCIVKCSPRTLLYLC
jgi:hypothetical protein